MEQNEKQRMLFHDLRAKIGLFNQFLYLIQDLPMDEDLREVYENVNVEVEGMKGVVEEIRFSK